MLYLLQQFWVFCLIALLLGVVVSYLTRGEKVGTSFWFNLLLILGVIGLIVALLFWFKGRGGLGLEVALLMLASYLVGCCIPCLLGCCGSKAAVVEAAKPAGLMAPRGGKGDDLTKLRMIDANRAAKLNGLGFYHYDQICALKGADREWLWKAIGLDSVSGAGSKASEWAGWTESCGFGVAAPVIKPVAVAQVSAPAAAVAPVVAAPVVAKVVETVAERVVVHTPKGTDLAAMPKVEGEDLISGKRPVGLYTARNNKADDLKRIRGIGPQNEGRLHGLGIWHFDQIAVWTQDNVEWVGSYLAFPGRIDREDWIGQSKILAAGGSTDFSGRVDRGEVETSKDNGSKGQGNVAHMRVDGFDGTRPKGIAAARNGKPDDLKLINGVGRVIEGKLHTLGIFHFDQVTSMTEAELKFISDFVGFPGRAIRENWAGESKILGSGGETQHSKDVKAGKIPSSL